MFGKNGGSGDRALLDLKCAHPLRRQKRMRMAMFGKNGGFGDRAVGSEVCAVSALGKADTDGDVWKKTGGLGTALLDLKSAQSLRWEKRGKAGKSGYGW